MAEKTGLVYIIGAGPGDEGLVTLKALDRISRADVIVYDRLVNPGILKYAQKDAELINVGKMPDDHPVPQGQINAILVDHALKGKRVARVKGGDPFVFGRGGEEAQALLQQGIAFEIIPGITSAVSVPAYAGIPVTHREYASSFHVVTGHESADKSDFAANYKALAAVEGTLVFLMGVKNLREITEKLVENGKAVTTPVAVIERGTTENQRVVTGNLSNITDIVKEAGIQSPAVTVVGDVVSLREELNWFPKGKLAGRRVVVTRTREQASKLSEKIKELGGTALEFPTIKITPPVDLEAVDQAISSVKDYQWLVFTSDNGVRSFLSRMKTLELDIRHLFGLKIAVVGPGTRDALWEAGLKADYMPNAYTVEALAKGLLERVAAHERVLLARSQQANPVLPELLSSQQISYMDLAVYQTLPDTTDRQDLIAELGKKQIDYITFTSSSTVLSFVSLLGKENLKLLEGVGLVCIGPVTERTAQEEGLKVAATANAYTIDGLVDKLIELTEG